MNAPPIPNPRAAMAVQKYMHFMLKELEGAIETNDGMSFAFVLSEVDSFAENATLIMRSVFMSDSNLDALHEYVRIQVAQDAESTVAERFNNAMRLMVVEMIQSLTREETS